MNRTAMAPLVLAALFAGCGDLGVGDTIIGRGPVIEESRGVGRFNAVSNSTLADVEIIQGQTERLRVRAQENLLTHIRTRVENNMLRIYTEPGVILQSSQPVLVELDVQALTLVENSGSGDVRVPLLDVRRLEVRTSGSGDIDLPDLFADTIVLFGSGSGDTRADGTVLTQRLVLSGSGRYEARDLESLEADVTMSGSGPATIRVRDRLVARLSGSGSLRYHGNPQLTQTVTGSGRVERAGN